MTEVFRIVFINAVAYIVIATYCMVITLAFVLYLGLIPVITALGLFTSAD